jgi:predicted permease
VRQLIIENTALGLLGTAGGILVSMGALKAILPLTGGRIPRLSAVEIDARVLAFAAALAVVTSLLFGIAPVLQASAVNPADGLKESARSIAQGRDRFRSGLVMIQVALGLVLLVAANLLMGGFVTLIRSDPGFQADRLLTVDLGASAAQFPVAEQIAFSDRLLERLRGIPAIRAAAAGTPLPLQGHEMRMAFDIEERRAAMPDRPRSDIAIVTPGYFAAMGIPLVQGRDFTDRDSGGSPPVVVVNQAFARKYFPGSNAIGKRIQPGTGLPPPMREIVGIVGNARQGASGAGDDPIYYFPYKQLPWRLGTVVLRTAGQPEEVEVDVRAALAGLDRRIAIRQVRSGDALALSLLAPAKFLTVLVGSFAAIALLLTATGLYGVLSYMVARRQREIGVRLALGAARRDVVRIVSRQAVLLVVPGLTVGALGAVAVTRLAGNVVFGIAVAAPLMVVAACAAVALISAAAAFLPATRAAAVDPIQVLRAE